MIKNLIIIYLILLCWYFFSNIKRNEELMVYNYGQIMVHIAILFGLCITFVLGLRVLNLFREYKTLDLNNLEFNFFKLLLCFILIISLRKLVFYRFKVSWFKVHYVMMCQNNFSFHEKYQKFYFNFIYSPAYYCYRYLIYLNYLAMLLLLISFSYDLIFNNLVLNYSLWYLRYYSLFRLIYICYSFNLMYPGNVNESIFYNFKDAEHLNLIEESKKYNQGVILEKHNYIHKNFGNTREMAYFKEVAKLNKT